MRCAAAALQVTCGKRDDCGTHRGTRDHRNAASAKGRLRRGAGRAARPPRGWAIYPPGARTPRTPRGRPGAAPDAPAAVGRRPGRPGRSPSSGGPPAPEPTADGAPRGADCLRRRGLRGAVERGLGRRARGRSVKSWDKMCSGSVWRLYAAAATTEPQEAAAARRSAIVARQRRLDGSRQRWLDGHGHRGELCLKCYLNWLHSTH